LGAEYGCQINTFEFYFMLQDFKKVFIKRRQNEKENMEFHVTKEYIMNVEDMFHIEIGASRVTFSHLLEEKLKRDMRRENVEIK
jgi:HKD family nuclease